MNALLDTCAVLGAARVRARLLDPATELTVTVVSAWEIAIQPEWGIVDVACWWREAARHLEARPVRLEHIAAREKLPLRDPFERLLLAPAVAGRPALVTSEPALPNYPEAVCIWD